MRYLGLDVHSSATVHCVLDAQGSVVERGSVSTTATELRELSRRLSAVDELVAAQEVGTQCCFVHDAIGATGVRIFSFNAAQLRMIAASRKKTDKRDAFWIAKALQTGMTPHPVHVPSAEVRNLRSMLHQRQALVSERKRWLLRARSYLRGAGVAVRKGASRITRMLEDSLKSSDGLPTSVVDGLELCARQQHQLGVELAAVEDALRAEARSIEAIQRLETIPAVGDWVAITLYAAVGDIRRFGSARLVSQPTRAWCRACIRAAPRCVTAPSPRRGRDRSGPRWCRRDTCCSGSATPRTPDHSVPWQHASTPRARDARSPSSPPRATSCGSPSTCCATGPPTTPSAYASRSARRAQRRRSTPSHSPPRGSETEAGEVEGDQAAVFLWPALARPLVRLAGPSSRTATCAAAATTGPSTHGRMATPESRSLRPRWPLRCAPLSRAGAEVCPRAKSTEGAALPAHRRSMRATDVVADAGARAITNLAGRPAIRA